MAQQFGWFPLKKQRASLLASQIATRLESGTLNRDFARP